MHAFEAQAGFIHAPSPMHEAFHTVTQAAHWCSLKQTCRGFTLSLRHIHDDRLLFCRFYNSSAVILSGEWISHVKEPTVTYAYTFQPGFFAPSLHVAAALVAPLHEESTTLLDAHRYCDAEVACVGFSLPRRRAGEEGSEAAWVVFVHEGGRHHVIFDSEHVSYTKGPPLPPPGSGPAAGAGYTLQPGLLGGERLHAGQLSLRAARSWCAARMECAGFSMEAWAAEGNGGVLDIAFWSAPQLTLADGHVSYLRNDAPRLGSYLQQPGYLPNGYVLQEASMSVREARGWCDRRTECAGFSLQVDLAPSLIASRTEAENLRATIRFSSSSSVMYVAPQTSWVYSWVSYTKVRRATRGRAANVGADPDAPVSWLVHPGFIVSSITERGAEAENLLRSDEQATLQDALEWCAPLSRAGCGGSTNSPSV